MAGSEPPGSGSRWPGRCGFVGGALVALGLVLGARALFGEEEPPTALAAPRLVEETAAAGLDHAYDGEFQFFVGGGVAVFDCDDDGFPDLYLAGGAGPASLYRNESEVGGALRFTRLADPATDLTAVTGAYPLDIDGDGVVDLAVLRVGENVLLRGLGECRFARANEEWSFDGGTAWTAAFSAKWEGDGGLPHPGLRQLPGARRGGRADARPATTACCCGPRTAGGYGAAIALSPGYCTLSVLFSDWDRSGRGDLRMANDRHYYRDGEEQLWRVAAGRGPAPLHPGGGLEAAGDLGHGPRQPRTSPATACPRCFIASQGDNKLQALDAGATGPAYSDIAIRRGVTAHRPFMGDDVMPSTAWHPEFQDVNNDGFIDLYLSKGNVEAMPDFAAEDPSNLLLGQPDGTFVEGARDGGPDQPSGGAGARRWWTSTWTACSTWWRSSGRENVRVWRNVGSGDAAAPEAMGHWLAVQLEQPGPNGFAVGAWIEVRAGDRTMLRELTVGGGHAGGQLGWIHFGLGERPLGRGPRPVARRGDRPVDAGDGGLLRRHQPRGGRAAFLGPGRGGSRGAPGERVPPGWRPSTCPSSACRRRCRRCRRGCTGSASNGSGSAARPAAGTGWWSTPTGSTAPTWPTSPVSTRASRRPCWCWGPRATRRSWWATSASAWPGPPPSGCAAAGSPDFSLPGQPRPRGPPLADLLAAEGIGSGGRVGVVGWKEYGAPSTHRCPGLPGGRPAGAGRAGGRGGERHRPADRRRRRAAGSQRGRAVGRLRVRRLPHLPGGAPAALRPAARDARGRGGRPARVERPAALLPPDAVERGAGGAGPG